MNKNSPYGYNYAVEADAKGNCRYFTKEEQRKKELEMKENNGEKLTQEEEKEYSKLKEYLKQMEKDVKIERKKQEGIEFGKRIRETREAVENFKRYNREEFEKIRDRLTKEFGGSLEGEKEFKKLGLDKIDFIEIIDGQIYSTEEYAKIAKEKGWDYIPTKEESNKKIDFLSKAIKEWHKVDKKEKKLTPEEIKENRKKYLKEAFEKGNEIEFKEGDKDLIEEIELEESGNTTQEIGYDKETKKDLIKEGDNVDKKEKKLTHEEERENKKRDLKEALKNGWRIKFDEETKELRKEIELEESWNTAQEIGFPKEYYLNKSEREIVKSNLEIGLKDKGFSEEEIKKEFERLGLDKIKFIEVIDGEKYSTEEYKKLAKDLDTPRISTKEEAKIRDNFIREVKVDKILEGIKKDWTDAKPRKSGFLNKLKKILFRK